MVASLAAIAIDASVLAVMGLFNVPESAFETTIFRIAVIFGVSLAIFWTRSLALISYRSALRQGHILMANEIEDIHLSEACPFRPLVILHFRLSGVSRNLIR